MILKAVFLGLEAGGKAVAAMNLQDAERLGVLSLARITIRFNGVEQAAIVHSSTELMQPGCIGVCRKGLDRPRPEGRLGCQSGDSNIS
jgi:hypothetical protein